MSVQTAKTTNAHIRNILLAYHGRLAKVLALNCQYDIDDLIQECHLYLVKRPPSDGKFLWRNVHMAMVDLMRKEFGRPRDGQVLIRKRSLRSHAIHHSLDNPLDPIVEALTATCPIPSDVPRLVAQAMEGLSLRQWWIVVQYFWMGEPMQAIGQRWGVTESRISQLMKTTLRQLRVALPPKRDLM